jgi:hypothetical protein
MHGRAAKAASEIARVNAFFPVMPLLGNRLARSRPFEGLTVGVSAHLTSYIGALLQELALGGGRFVLCAASEATTDPSVVDLLRGAGMEVHAAGARKDHQMLVIDEEPDLIVDAGANLIGTLLHRRPELVARLRGAVELSKSGSERLKQLSVPFPVHRSQRGAAQAGDREPARGRRGAVAGGPAAHRHPPVGAAGRRARLRPGRARARRLRAGRRRGGRGHRA